MKVLVSEQNGDAIAKALAAANGRASTHTASVQDVLRLAERAEIHFDIADLPKTRRGGAEAVWRGAGPRAKSYRYPMTRTRLTIKRSTSKDCWYLTGAERERVYPLTAEEFAIVISGEQRDWIVRHTLESFRVRNESKADVPPEDEK